MLTKYEKFVLDWHLSEYPSGWDYDRVLETLEDNGDDCRNHISIWSMYEDCPVGELCNSIDTMKDQLEINFPERT
jgi:hypothetical protein